MESALRYRPNPLTVLPATRRRGWGNVKGIMFPSSADDWHVTIRITADGLIMPHWLSCQEMSELNVALTQLALMDTPENTR